MIKNNIKRKKRGGIVVSLVAATSLVIFSFILISIIVNFGRGGRIADSSLDELQEVIQRVKSSSNVHETIEVFIGPESAIIGYVPYAEKVVTNFEARRIDTTSNILYWQYQFKEEYTFPEPRGDLEGTFQHGVHATFLGYIKERPDNCPIEHFCICECINIDLETREESDYSSHNAFLICGDEQCRIVRDLDMHPRIHLQDFFPNKNEYQSQEDEEYVDFYERLEELEDEIELYPDPSTFFWDGGFIFLRSQNANLGRKTYLCIGDFRNLYYRFDDCRGEILKEEKLIESKRVVAGITQDYMADFFNLRISNTGPNRVSFEVYG